MNGQQTKEICQRVCTVEGKTWTVELSQAWHELLKGLEMEVAERATSLALQDHNIHAVGPKHILSKVPAAVSELNAVLRRNGMDESGWRSEPEPVCREHDLPITHCAHCCGVLASEAGHLYGDRLHEWAIAHVYREDSLVAQGHS